MTEFHTDLLRQTVLYQLQLSKQFLFGLASDISAIPKTQVVAYYSMLLDKINDSDRTLAEFVSKLPLDNRPMPANKDEQVPIANHQADQLRKALENIPSPSPSIHQDAADSSQGGIIGSEAPPQSAPYQQTPPAFYHEPAAHKESIPQVSTLPINRKRGVNKYPANPGNAPDNTQAANVVWGDGFDPNYHQRQ